MNKNIYKSYLFVSIQFIALGLIVSTGNLFPTNDFLLLMEFSGMALGIWAIFVMRIGHFNIVPDPLNWSQLVVHGPYSIIRHPMYTSLLVTTFPLIIHDFSMVRLMYYIILFVNLVLKLHYEETLLIQVFPEYPEYRKGTYKLFPYIY